MWPTTSKTETVLGSAERRYGYCVAVGGSGRLVTWEFIQLVGGGGGVTWNPLRNVCFKHLSVQLQWLRSFAEANTSYSQENALTL